jgi:hypothetical protein
LRQPSVCTLTLETLNRRSLSDHPLGRSARTPLSTFLFLVLNLSNSSCTTHNHPEMNRVMHSTLKEEKNRTGAPQKQRHNVERLMLSVPKTVNTVFLIFCFLPQVCVCLCGCAEPQASFPAKTASIEPQSVPTPAMMWPRLLTIAAGVTEKQEACASRQTEWTGFETQRAFD